MDSPFPEDMERRRLADLEMFVAKHPNDPMVPLIVRQLRASNDNPNEAANMTPNEDTGWQQRSTTLGRQSEHDRSFAKPDSKFKRSVSVNKGKGGNKWDTQSTLELLAEMTRVGDSSNESGGSGMGRIRDPDWAIISQKLPNPCGIESAKFKRSCRVHFINLYRIYKGKRKCSGKDGRLDVQVHKALEEYLRKQATRAVRKGSDKEEEMRPNKGLDMRTRTDDVPGEGTSNVTPKKIQDEKTVTLSEKVDRNGTSSNHESVGTWDGNRENINDIGKKGNDSDCELIEPSTKNKMSAQNGVNEEIVGLQLKQNARSHHEAVISSTMKAPKTWDKTSSLKLLAAMNECTKNSTGAKEANRWERVAAKFPNHPKIDPQSCRTHYAEMMRICRNENENKVMDKLDNDVQLQLEKWLQLCSPTLKTKESQVKNTKGHHSVAGVEELSTKQKSNCNVEEMGTLRNGALKDNLVSDVGKNTRDLESIRSSRSRPSCKLGMGNIAIEIESSSDDSLPKTKDTYTYEDEGESTKVWNSVKDGKEKEILITSGTQGKLRNGEEMMKGGGMLGNMDHERRKVCNYVKKSRTDGMKSVAAQENEDSGNKRSKKSTCDERTSKERVSFKGPSAQMNDCEQSGQIDVKKTMPNEKTGKGRAMLKSPAVEVVDIDISSDDSLHLNDVGKNSKLKMVAQARLKKCRVEKQKIECKAIDENSSWDDSMHGDDESGADQSIDMQSSRRRKAAHDRARKARSLFALKHQTRQR